MAGTNGAPTLGESIGSLHINVDQPDNEADPPAQGNAAGGLSGYAWTRRRGYFVLPPDAVEDHLGVRIWHHDSQSWRCVIGEGMWNDGSDRSEDGWSNRSYGNDRDYKSKKRDGDIPEWDGKSEHRTTHFRRIDLWAATTGVDPED